MSSNRRTPERPNHEDAKRIRRCVAWLTNLERLDPLQAAVGRDLADILDATLTTRAVVAIRVINHGGRPPWSRERLDDLERLLRAGHTNAQIAERLGLTEASVRYQVGNHGLTGIRHRGPRVCGGGGHLHLQTPLMRARDVMQRRRLEQTRRVLEPDACDRAGGTRHQVREEEADDAL